MGINAMPRARVLSFSLLTKRLSLTLNIPGASAPGIMKEEEIEKGNCGPPT